MFTPMNVIRVIVDKVVVVLAFVLDLAGLGFLVRPLRWPEAATDATLRNLHQLAVRNGEQAYFYSRQRLRLISQPNRKNITYL